MDFLRHITPSTLEGMQRIAESDQFAIYAAGEDTYLLVQRHESMPWTALRLSGDGVFRAGSLFADAMRHLYRDVAAELSLCHRRSV
ncbi:MAG: hypothetical protein ACXWNK_12695 [Vulcanimicrobiaceae bacterium]